MLKISNLSANIDKKSILRGFSLNINPGEVHAIMGPNDLESIYQTFCQEKGYEISGDILFENKNLFDLETEERHTREFFSFSISIRNSRCEYKHFS